MMCKKTSAVICTLILLPMAFAAPTAASAQQQSQFQPSLGQPGKDVMWVPTPKELIEGLFDLAKVNASDYVIDLGSGDGPWVIAAAKRGARALGVEFNPDMVALSRSNAQKEGVADKATFVQGDIFEADFSQATVITMYLLPDLNMKLRPKILEMKPGTRVLSHAFTMEDWEADQTISVGSRTGYMWIVPAKVAGTWTWQAGSAPAELTLSQNFQKIEGSLRINGRDMPLKNAKLNGAKITFAVGDTVTTTQMFSGTVSGNTITGTVGSGAASATKWNAARRAAK